MKTVTFFFTGRSKNTEDTFLLRLLSFNILAQNLLETYHFLYKRHNKQALDWNIRKSLIIEEILEAEANVCIYIFYILFC